MNADQRRWKIRRKWLVGRDGYFWVVLDFKLGRVHRFNLWENAILYVDIHEAGA